MPAVTINSFPKVQTSRAVLSCSHLSWPRIFTHDYKTQLLYLTLLVIKSVTGPHNPNPADAVLTRWQLLIRSSITCQQAKEPHIHKNPQNSKKNCGNNLINSVTWELGTRAFHQCPPFTRSTSLKGIDTLPMTQWRENLSKSTTVKSRVLLWASKKGISNVYLSSNTGFCVLRFTPVCLEFFWSGRRQIFT